MSWPEAFVVVSVTALGFGALVLLLRHQPRDEEDAK